MRWVCLFLTLYLLVPAPLVLPKLGRWNVIGANQQSRLSKCQQSARAT